MKWCKYFIFDKHPDNVNKDWVIARSEDSVYVAVLCDEENKPISIYYLDDINEHNQ